MSNKSTPDKAPPPEFSRVYRLTQIHQQPLTLDLSANAEERAALVRRFGLVGLERLDATLTLTADGEDILADGTLRADVEQACVATGEPLAVHLDEPLLLRFVPEPEIVETEPDDGEIADASDGDARDIVHFEGGAIDVGEALAETLLLSLDPYPRSPGADQFLKQTGVLSEEDAGPFGALASLRDALGKSDQ